MVAADRGPVGHRPLSGVDTFTYWADDGNNSASATVTINVSP